MLWITVAAGQFPGGNGLPSDTGKNVLQQTVNQGNADCPDCLQEHPGHIIQASVVSASSWSQAEKRSGVIRYAKLYRKGRAGKHARPGRQERFSRQPVYLRCFKWR